MNKKKKMDGEKFATIMGTLIAIAAAFIAFLRGMEVSVIFMLFLLVFIFSFVFVLVADDAYRSLTGRDKNKGKNEKQ